MHSTTRTRCPRRRYVFGDEDLADLDVHPLTYGGPAARATAGSAPIRQASADPSATEDPDPPAVVCAVGDDDLAQAVVAAGADLAERLGLRLTLVHSPDPDLFLVGEMHRAALARGHALLDRVAERWPAAARVVQTGDPAALLAALAADRTAFVVVGTRGREALTSALLGSVSNEIARRATCPVVIVPAASASAVEGEVRHAPAYGRTQMSGR
jgi:nucleotide-binding universal stress UspA family protein